MPPTSLLQRRKRGPFAAQAERLPIWLTGTMLGIATCMVVALLILIAAKGLGAFWPKEITALTLADGRRYMGTVQHVEKIPSEKALAETPAMRTLLRIANRDLYGSDFVWLDDAAVQAKEHPQEAVMVERLEWGPFVGFLSEVRTPEGNLAAPAQAAAEDYGVLWKTLRKEMKAAAKRLSAMRKIEKGAIGDINTEMERHRLAIRKVEVKGDPQSSDGQARIARERAAIAKLDARYAEEAQSLQKLREADRGYRVVLSSIEGKTKELPISSLVRIHRPNRLNVFGKLGVYFDRLGEFIFGQPREANSEGGVAPAIFGTVMMTLLMTIAVVPLGVLGALYLHEYAKQGFIVSCVRVAVNNLAGVPSIVFGVFGLGFFCYTIGGTIDQMWFSERLPSPTFGGGGILWAALTLALLTVPVVIVATEEALAAVPNGVRAASLACGATKFQTICRVVLPAALPGILTGAILAMARGAGEVAPLMITGVVKLAPELPLDGVAPFLHLERKFMHLGFHIYDVGFQSPNVEASKPMVYMTTLLLLGIVVCLNLAAMQIRGRLRENFRGAEV